jgi:LPS-assembly protein
MIQGNGASAWEDSDSENRYLYNLGGEVGTTLMHDFTAHIGEVNAWSHTLRPYVAYSYTSIADQAFVPQFDNIDALREQNILYYGVNNFFTIHGERKGREYDREYAFLKVIQGYDLRDDDHDTSLRPVAIQTGHHGSLPARVSDSGPLTPVEMRTGFYPLEFLRLMYTTDIDVYGEGAYLHSIEADYASSRGDLLGLDYRYNTLTDVNSVSGNAWYLLPYNFAAGYTLQRAIEKKETLEEIVRLRYIQPCWSVELSSNSTPGDQTFMMTFRLANIGTGFGVPGL